MKHTIREVTLKNGAKGLIIHAPGVNVVHLVAEFRAGFIYGDKTKYELPHVMEHMMFTNKTYPKPRQFSMEVEQNGAYINAYTNATSLEYEYECADFEAERIVKLLAIQLSEPTFPQAELKNELGNVIEELNNCLSNPGRTNAYNLNIASNGDPTYQTRIAQLEAITSDDLKAHYHQTHTGENLRFIMAGDADFDQLLTLLDTKLAPGKRLKVPKHPTKHLKTVLFEKKDIPQVHYCLFSCLDSKISYRELIAARILVTLLSDGFSSTLYGKAREKGLVYGLSMRASNDDYESFFSFSGTVSPENAAKYLQLTVTEISKVLNGKFTQRSFNATKQLMRGSRARHYQRLSELVSYYQGYFSASHEPFGRFDELLDEITKAEAIAALRLIIQTGCWGVSFTGNITKTKAGEYRQILSPLFAPLDSTK